MHPEVIGRGYRAKLLDTLIERMSESATIWFATARRCGSLRRAMTFPVHRSTERSPRERGEAFGRAQAEPIAKTLALYERMFAETGVDGPGGPADPAAAARGDRSDRQRARTSTPTRCMAVNARTEILAGHGPTECSVVGAGGLLAQNWDWHPESATVIQIVEHDERLVRDAHRGRDPGQDRAQRRGPRRLPEPAPHHCRRRLHRHRRSTSSSGRRWRPAEPSTRRSSCSRAPRRAPAAP